MKIFRLLPWIVAGIAGITVGSRTGAQTSFPMLSATYPAGVARGKTTEVTVYAGGNGGANLYGAYKALFEGQGVKAEIVPPDKGWPALDPKKPFVIPGVSEIKMRVTVAPDAPLGTREYRVGTPYHGISSVGLLVIGDEPEVLETEPNNDLEHAQTVALPCVVNGKIQQGEDVDCFKFKATAGQEVVFTVECARLEDKMHDLQEHADPLLILRDSTGAELDRNDDYYRADPMFHHKFEKAGEYVVQIRDVGYKGNPYWVYRLTLTTRPYVTAVVPAAVQPGHNVDLQVTGFNLGGATTAHLDVPADAPRGLWTAQLKLPNGVSNLVPLLVSDTTQNTVSGRPMGGNRTVTAALPNPAAASPDATLTLPGSVNTFLTRESAPDRYRFHAKKGESWGFEVTARRLDSEMDSIVRLRDAKGALLAENDDAKGKDSRLDWSAPADGDYLLDVLDLTGKAGTTFFYNLTAQPLSPNFQLRCDSDRAMIAPGNRTAVYVLLERQYGFAGDVKVEVRGLPAGVTATPLTLPAGIDQGVFILSAAPGTAKDTSTLQVVGIATLPGPDGKPAESTRIARPMTEIYLPGGGRGLMGVNTQGVSVTEQNDLEVMVNTQQVTLMPGGTVKIDVTLKRRPDYTKPVTLDVRVQHLGGIFTNPLPPGVTVDDGASKTLLGDNENTGSIVLRAAADAKPIKDWPIAVLANVSINFVMKVWYAAPLVSLTVPVPAKK